MTGRIDQGRFESLSVPLLRRLRDEAGTAMRTYGLALMDRDRLEIATKANDLSLDIVTNVDLAIQKAMQGAITDISRQYLPPPLLERTFFAGEEEFKSIGAVEDSLIWLLDPLDGTQNFAFGLPCHAISLGLIFQGVPMLGIVIDAITGEVFDSIRNDGARLNGEPIMRSCNATQAPVCLSSGTLRLVAGSTNPNALSQLLEPHGKMRLFGSQALQLCWASCGRLSLNVNREARLWDDVAGALIAREAGVAYIRLAGGTLDMISAHDAALQGEMLFSLCGDSTFVQRARDILLPLARTEVARA